MCSVPLFKQTAYLSVFASRSIAKTLVHCIDCLVKGAVQERSDGSKTKKALTHLSNYLKDLHRWWTSELIFDPISPVHGSMKDALIQAADDRWKDESIVWAALLKSFLFESVTIDCICGLTDCLRISEQVDEDLYQEVLRLVGPLPLRNLEFMSGNLHAWQTKMVRDLLCHSPKVTSVKVPLLTHYILDGIVRTPNLEKLEMVISQNWKDWSFSCGKLDLIQKVAKVFFGSEDLYSLIEKAGKLEDFITVPFPKLKQFNIAVDYNTTELCHLFSCYYPNVKLGQFYVPSIEYFSYLIAFKSDEKMWGVGSFFPNEIHVKNCCAPPVLHFDHLILSDIIYGKGYGKWNMVGLTKLDIFNECIEEDSTVLSDFLEYCDDVVKLGITSMNILSGISRKSSLLQITCLELSPKVNVLEVFAHIHKFPNLRHFMCFYPTSVKVNSEGSAKFHKIEELTINFSSKETVPEGDLIKFFMASFPNLQKLNLNGVTCAIWTSGWLDKCGQTLVKSLTLTTDEELCSCSCDWLEVFPKLEDFTLQSTVLHRQCLPASSRLKIKYCGFVCPYLEWFDNYKYDDKIYPIDE